MMKIGILATLLLITAVYVIFWWSKWPRPSPRPTPLALAIGALTNFFDALGIGSFATTTVLFRSTKLVDDRLIPGTLNAGHAIPIFVQALIYISIVVVDPLTLISMILASVLGAWQGARLISKLDKRKIQLGMGVGLTVAAGLMLSALLRDQPVAEPVTRLEGLSLAIGIAANFIFGALMTIGIGAYAPIMVTVTLLGMNETTAFPIMMGSCASLMPIASYEFIRHKSYDPATALGLTLGGIPAVIIAAFVVKSLPLDTVKCLVIMVVLYAAYSLIRTATRAPS